MATHSSIPAWRIPRTEEPGVLLSMGSNESDTTKPLTHTRIHDLNWKMIVTLQLTTQESCPFQSC